MSARRNGNSRREPPPAAPPLFQEGDVVAITQAAHRIPKLATMTPRLLYRLGFDNAFMVLRQYEDPDDGPCVSLYPCCTVLNSAGDVEHRGLLDRETGQPRCGGHPVSYFEKIDMVRLPKKGDKTSAAVLPFGIGELLGFEWLQDEDNPQFTARFLGKGGTFTGAFAKALKKFAEDNNLI